LPSIEVLVSRGPSVDYTMAIRLKVPIVFAYSGDRMSSGRYRQVQPETSSTFLADIATRSRSRAAYGRLERVRARS